ncbi:hypothetical protein [Sphingomonas sp.]|uniref:hypothetical protein n=1 Tax=Sphingomonas sp. TaxID=28214 RepID=UPI003BAD712B
MSNKAPHAILFMACYGIIDKLGLWMGFTTEIIPEEWASWVNPLLTVIIWISWVMAGAWIIVRVAYLIVRFTRWVRRTIDRCWHRVIQRVNARLRRIVARLDQVSPAKNDSASS